MATAPGALAQPKRRKRRKAPVAKTTKRRRPRMAKAPVKRRKRRTGMSEAQRKEYNLNQILTIGGHVVGVASGILMAIAIPKITSDITAVRLLNAGMGLDAIAKGQWGRAAGQVGTALVLEISRRTMGDNASYLSTPALAMANGEPMFIDVE